MKRSWVVSEWLLSRRPVPVGGQLVPVQLHPFSDERHGSSRQGAVKNIAGRNGEMAI